MAKPPSNNVEIELMEWGKGPRSIKVDDTYIHNVKEITINSKYDSRPEVTVRFLADKIAYTTVVG